MSFHKISNNQISFQNQIYNKIDSFSAGKSGISYLYESSDKKIILKQFLPEKESYIPFEEKLSTEINSYKILQTLPINIPELLFYNSNQHFLIKEFIDGELLSNKIAKNELDDQSILSFMKMLTEVYHRGYNIDYFPNNFVFFADKLFYIDYEVQPFSYEWNFENWGIFYWLNPEGVKYYLETGSADKLNRPGEFKPFQPLEAITKIKSLIKNI